jgi:hypothetical protein
MTARTGFRATLRSAWLAAWPVWLLLVFCSLAAVRLVPVVYARAALAAPILLLVPGSLTLGAVFSGRRRPRGAAFACYAVLLSAIWSAFASLALYAPGLLITARNTFWALLAVAAALATVAQVRLILERPGRGRRVAPAPAIPDPDLSEAETSEAGVPAAARHSGRYAFFALVAGISLIAGGLYAYEQLPRPAPAGYTFVAWAGPRVSGPVTIGAAGTSLHFQIVHREPVATTFRVTATWAGSPPRQLARPVVVSIGPDRTFTGTLLIPPLPDGCTYRIVVALTAARQISPLTHHPQLWSINADVHDPAKSAKACRR